MYSLYDEFYLDTELSGVKSASAVFGAKYAALSAVAVAIVGALTLTVRYHVDVLFPV
jgi:hypothetical protein